MKNISSFFKFVSVIFISGVLFSACQYAKTPSSAGSASQQNATNNSTTNQANVTSVSIQNMVFSPKDISVKVGQTVTWTNKDGFAHTVTSDSGAFDSGNISGGGTFSFTFTKTGTYQYHCNIHPSMTAQITVTN